MSDAGRGSRNAGLMFGLLGTAALLSHIHAVGRPGVSGPILILDHIFNLGAASLLLALCAAIGRRTTRLAGFRHDSAVEEVAFSAAIGGGVLGTLLLILGGFGGFHPLSIAMILLASMVAVWPDLARMPRLCVVAGRELADQAGPLVLTVSVAVGAGMVVLAVAPPTDWDSLMYHLRIPAQFLETGRVHVPPDNLHVSFVGLFHLLYVPLLAAGAPAACQLINVLACMLLGAVVLTMGMRLFSATTGRLALLLLWGSPILILSAVTPRIDGVLALYLLLGHYALIRAWQTPEEGRRWATLAGATLGFAFAVKYLALGYALALVPLALVAAHRQGETVRDRARLAAGCVAAGSVVMLPWLIKNWLLLGAPLYPQFAEYMLPPWLASLYGSSDIPNAVSRASLHPLGTIRETFSLRDWFFSPGAMTPEAEGTAYGANRAFLALLFVPLLVRNRSFLGVLLPGLLFIGVLLLHNTSLNLRYLIPALPSLTLASAALLAHAADSARQRWLRTTLLVLVTGVTIMPGLRAMVAKLADTGASAIAAGIASREAFLENPRNSETAGYITMVSRVNALTTAEDRILLLFEARGFRFKARTLQDNNLTNWPLIVPASSAGSCLEPAGVTHVLVAMSTLGYFRLRGLDPAILEWGRFPEFAARCLQPVEAGRGWFLYRIEARPDVAPTDS